MKSRRGCDFSKSDSRENRAVFYITHWRIPVSVKSKLERH